MLIFFIGFIFGGFTGAIIIALLVAGSDDKEAERKKENGISQ